MTPAKTVWTFRSEVRRLFSLAGFPIAGTVFLYLARSNDTSVIDCLLAFLLLLLPWRAYLGWRNGGRQGLPIFAMLAFMYWLYYAVPLFMEEHIISNFYEPIGHQLPETTLTRALLMALIGICSMWLGTKSGLARFVVPRTRLSVELTPAKLNYVRAVLVGGGLLSLYSTPLQALGDGGRQLVSIMVSIIPLLAFAILFRSFVKGEAETVDKLLIFGFLFVRLFSGLSGGWLGVAASILVICGAIYLAERGRAPRAAIIAVAMFTLFFQVGKEDFRNTYWQRQGSDAASSEGRGGRLERVAYWAQVSLIKWGEALTDPSGEALRGAINPSVSRISLLNQTANVIDQTPSVVPYQNGALYSYMIYTWIPRFVWPEKPSMSEANQFYQVAYGLTQEDNLGAVSISVGFLAEAFINFGWLGVVGIMFLMGIFFDFYHKTFLAPASGVVMTGIGLILLPQFLSIESQMAQYVGGIVQQVVVTIIVMLPIVRFARAPGSPRPIRTLPTAAILTPK
jgi:hypothetical protein